MKDIGKMDTPPRRDPLGPIVLDIRRDLNTEQLSAIGAIALQFNVLEAHLDLLIGISLSLGPATHYEVLTRLGTIDSKIDLAKAMPASLGIVDPIKQRIQQSLSSCSTRVRDGLPA